MRGIISGIVQWVREWRATLLAMLDEHRNGRRAGYFIDDPIEFDENGDPVFDRCTCKFCTAGEREAEGEEE